MRLLPTLFVAALRGPANACAVAPADTPEPEAHTALRSESSVLFVAKDYKALDARMEQYVSRKTRIECSCQTGN